MKTRNTWTLAEAVEYLDNTLGYLYEHEQERVATPAQIKMIVRLAEKAAAIMEPDEEAS